MLEHKYPFFSYREKHPKISIKVLLLSIIYAVYCIQMHFFFTKFAQDFNVKEVVFLKCLFCIFCDDCNSSIVIYYCTASHLKVGIWFTWVKTCFGIQMMNPTSSAWAIL